MSIDYFEDDFRKLLNAICIIQPETTFVIANQNGTEAISPYCLVDILTEEVIGIPEESMINKNNSTYIVETIQTTVRFSFHGTISSSAYSDARRFMTTICSFNGRKALFDNGFSLNPNISALRRINIARDTTMYINNYFDIILYSRKYTNYSQEPIDQTDIGYDLAVSDNDHIIGDFTTKNIEED